jgi:hypothetical protein
MGYALTDLAANYSNEFPIYGSIADTTALRLCVRASGYSNLLDVSPEDHTLTFQDGAVFGANGPVLGENRAIVTDLPEQDDSFTIIAAFKASLNGLASYNCYVGGTFSGTSSAGGVGLNFRSDASGTGGSIRTYLRSTLRKKKISDGTYSVEYTDLVVQDNLLAHPAETGWMYVASKFDHTTKTTIVKVLNMGLSETRQIGTHAEYVAAAGDRGLVDTDGSVLYHKIGDAPKLSATLNNTVVVPHYMFYGRVLTDQQLNTQKELDQKWLLAARGITL